MAFVPPVRVTGLREFETALKTLEGDLPKYLRSSLKLIGNIVYEPAHRRIPRRTGRTAKSARLSVTARRVSIKAGGEIAPWFPWLDFGGSTGRGHRPRVAWSGAIKRTWMGAPRGSGRYFWKSFKDHHQEIQDRLEILLADVARRAGLQVDYEQRRAQLQGDFDARRGETA